MRILQRMGPVSLGVSLPRDWVEQHGLHVGSSVDARTLSDGSLRLRTQEESAKATRHVDVEVAAGLHPEHLFRRLLGAYLAGASAFEIRQPGGITGATRGVVRSFTRRTIQPEVISEEKALLRLQDVSDESPVPLAKLVGRMGQLVMALHQDAGRSWAHLSVGTHIPWESRDDEVDRQAWFIERSAVRMLDGEPLPSGPDGRGIGPLGWYTVARSLERIADHAVRMGEVGNRLADSSVPGAYLTSLEQFHQQSLAHLTEVLEVLQEQSAARANELLDTGEALRSVGRTLLERLFSASGSATLPASTALALGQLIESIGRTTAYAEDIAQVALDRGLPDGQGGAPRPPSIAGRRRNAPSRAAPDPSRSSGPASRNRTRSALGRPGSIRSRWDAPRGRSPLARVLRIPSAPSLHCCPTSAGDFARGIEEQRIETMNGEETK